MSRIQKFGKRKGAPSEDFMDETAAALEAEWGLETNGQEKLPLPPRRQSHPSSKQQLTRWFYRLLIVLFLLLLAGMLWWGRQFD
ncbi:hypothetical protein [Paenibacillus glycinis]|uniref:Uncharacterized protein n=1 Tax=Paenibacillus glycinis TaxID=2697035 RepID=A0ABW9XJH9_9BACL|nr:hypothetical protein [Paenibacillus glycinis]NBD22617.1 hypothetical protein [Paenibacillus glycinis]